MSSRARVLLGTQLLFNVGFYAVVPFLAGVLREDFALAGAAVGLVLGLRTAAQQGMFLFGGALADRFGARALILFGCAVRVIGFAMLAWSTTLLPGLMVAEWGGLRLSLFVAGTVLTGLGGAMFSPALQILVARADSARAPSPRPQVTLFALLAVFGETGAALGPLLGALLLGWGFPAVAASGAVLFTLIAIALFRLLPRDHASLDAGSAGSARRLSRADFFDVLRDRRFVALAALTSVNLLAYNQLYLGFPVELARVGAGAGGLGLLFAWVSILTIALQIPITRVMRRWGDAPALRTGFLLISAAFAVLAVAAPVPPGSGASALVPVFASTGLLTLGHLILNPLVLSLVSYFAPERRWGSYYGLLATLGGVCVLVGNALLGALYPFADVPTALASAPWAVLAVLPLLPVWLAPRLIPHRQNGSAPPS